MKRTVFITGGSRGIGAAICAAFERAGYHTIAPDRKKLDLAQPEAVAKYLRAGGEWNVDVLVNNAGVNLVRPIEEMKLSDWARVVDTNLTAGFQLLQAFIPHMKKKRWGRVINISSIYAQLGRAGRLPYSASKAGLIGLTRTAAVELGEFNILVNAVCPGFVDTEMTRANNSDSVLRELCEQTPLKRLGRPEEIAGLTLFLGSEQNSFITGQAIFIDGGFSSQ